MLSRRCCFRVLFLATVLTTVSTATVSAQRVELTAHTIEAVESGGFVDVKFRITVTNGEASPLLNLWVQFDDQREVHVGDVEAEGSASSAEHTLAIDPSTPPTRHRAIPVKLKFTHAGANVEQERTLFVNLDVPGEEQR